MHAGAIDVGCMGVIMLKTIRLRAAIAVVYFLVTIPLLLGVSVYLYTSNSELALQHAAQDMQKVAHGIRRDVAAILNPVRRVVGATAQLIRTSPNIMQTPHSTEYFRDQLNALPQVFSLYAGFAQDGGLYQFYHIPNHIEKLGPWNKSQGEQVNYAVRHVGGSSDKRDESYIFYGDWKDIRFVDRAASQYDPRQHQWYREATQSNDIILSDVFADAPSKFIGLTMSKRVMSPSGELIGVVAADVSLDALSVFLNAMQMGANGRVFVLDETNNVVGAIRKTSAADDDDLASDQIITKAIQQWQGGQSAAFEFKSPLPKKLYEKAPKYVQRWLTEIEKDLKSVSFERHEDYLASFSRFPLEGGRSWTIGILVNKEDILSPLYANSLRVVMLGGGVILILFVALMYVSRCLSHPMKAVVKEADSLRNLDLSEPFETTSRIMEIQQLISAVDSMSNSLRAFDRFVPRKLVTNIVDNGKNTNLSSRQAEISVLVARIDNFSQMLNLHSAPDILQYLNLYYDRLTAVVHDNRGLVDRYVEDTMCAIWNAPISDPVHLENACRAVLACHEASIKLAQECLEGEVPHFHAKFGLHIGTAVVGKIGSFDRVRYAAMGPVVQLATNLEHLNSVYGTNILVSESVVDRITPQFVTRPVDMVMMDGQDYPIKIHELIAERRHLQKKGQLDQAEQMCEDWSYALGLYFAGQWAEAIRAFEGYNNKYPDDPLTPLFLKRSEDYQFDPPPNWDGAQKNQDK